MNYDKNSPESIAALFSSIASDYDRANAIASFGLHALWNRALINSIVKKKQPQVHLDLCCGTGAIGVPLARRAGKTFQTLHLLDFSQPMLEKALHRALHYGLKPQQIEIHWADAQKIPLASQSVDSVTIAYGIRNVQNPAALLKEVYRVLKPGGLFGLLELSQPENPVLRGLHRFFLEKGMPRLTALVASNQAAYRYLSSSIQGFMPIPNLQLLLQTENLRFLEKRHFLCGVASLLLAQKD